MIAEDQIILKKLNEVWLEVNAEKGVLKEIYDYFSYYEKGYQFKPAYKNKFWDGKKRLFNMKERKIYIGLLDELKKFFNERNYSFKYDEKKVEFSVKECIEFVEKLNLPFVPHDFQYKALLDGVRNKRLTFLSPTASGKSLVIYMLTRYYATKTLIIVPTINLIDQMYGDFKDYGFDSDKFCQKIHDGKNTKKPILISTWQSITNMPQEWYDQFELIIGDEAHTFSSDCTVSIMESLTKCENRFSLTGTFDGAELSEYVITGLFGPVKVLTTTSELIDKKILTKLKIKCIVLKYNNKTKLSLKSPKYQKEIEFIANNKERNNFIKNLAISIKNNTLLLFNFRDHGNILYNLISENTDRPIFYIDGNTDGDIRESVRNEIENSTNAIVVASYGTFSTGVNIKNLHNIIFCSPYKARIRILQSIGRTLRKHESKDHAVLYDIVDDLSYKDYRNTTLNHFMERIKIYNESKFPYKIINVPIGEDTCNKTNLNI